MSKMMTERHEKRRLTKIGCLALFILMLILALPAYGQKRVVNAGKAIKSGMDRSEKRELIEKRTINSKTTLLEILPDGRGRYALDTSMGPIHYKEDLNNPDEPWKDIDTTIKPTDHAEYQFHNQENFFKSYFKIKSTARDLVKYQLGNSFITYTLKDNELGTLGDMAGYPEGNMFIYPQAYPGVDVKYSVHPVRLLEEFVFYSYRPVERISQEIYFEGAYFEQQDDGSYKFYDAQTNEKLWTIPQPVMYEVDDPAERSYGLHYELSCEGNTCTLVKVLDEEGKVWLADGKRNFPVAIDATIDRDIAASSDDAEVYVDGYRGSGTTIMFGGVQDYPADYGQGYRFTNITIPQGSYVSSAYLSLVVNAYSWNNISVRLTAIDQDNTATFSSGSPPGSRPITSSYIAVETPNIERQAGTRWNFPSTSALQQTLGSAINAVVNRAGWSSGNALAVVNNSDQDPNAAVNYSRDLFRTYDYGTPATNGPKLHIEYNAPGSAISLYRSVGITGAALAGAFPVVQATNSSADTTMTTSHTVSLPSGIQSGDLLIAIVSCITTVGAIDISWPAEWTEVSEQDVGSASPWFAASVGYRKANGSEGASITVTTNVNCRSAHNSYRITGAVDPATQPPQAAWIGYTDTSSTIDPPSLTPTGGAKDYLWLAAAGWQGDAISASTDPTNYTNPNEGKTSGQGGAGTALRSLRRTFNAASENPSAFTLGSTTSRRVGVTIAVHPIASPSNGLTISGSTATFDSGLPDNIGVGDVIQYDSDDNGTIDALAFIHGRTSSTVYTVKNKDGGAPTQTTVKDYNWAIYRAYTSLANWQSQTENGNIAEPTENDVNPNKNLTSANTVMMVACYGDGADTAAVTITGWTTGANNYIKIYTPVSSVEVGNSQRHNGKWDTSKYRLETAGTGSTCPINITGAGYVWIDGLQIYLNPPGGSGNAGILVNQSATVTNHKISNNIVRSVASTYDYNGIYMYAAAAGSYARIWNNIFYDFTGTLGRGIAFQSSSFTGYVYNNTVYNCYYGYYIGAGTVIAKNNIYRSMGISGADGYYGTFSGSSDYNSSNISGDAPVVSPRSNTVSPWYSGAFTDADIFIAPGATPRDLHLSGNSIFLDEGFDLSSDANLAFSDDIDGQIRPMDSSWDIGADEGVVVPPTHLYRSVGITATALAVGTHISGAMNGLTISGSTATFDKSLPDNIGVGDVIQYDSDDNGSIDALAFIHGRVSSTVYTVKNKTGGAPTQTTAKDYNWAIYRAYTSLANWQSQTENSNISEPTEDDVNPSKNLITANTVVNVACYADGADTTAVTITGWTTRANNYIKIYTPYLSSEVGATQRHNGTWSGGGYSREVTTTGNALLVSDKHVRIEGLRLSVTASSGGPNPIRVEPSGTGTDVRISHCIIRGILSGTVDSSEGIVITGTGTGVVRIWNNIVYDFNVGPTEGAGLENYAANQTAYMYNNTVYNCVRGIWRSAGTIVAKNNIAYNNTDNWVGTFDASSTNNLSGPGSDAQIPLTNARNGVTVTFVDPNGSPRNLHLASFDTGAKDYGTNLSSDANLAFSDDIDGEGRVGPWDIGADEILTFFEYRRVITINVSQRGSSCTGSLSNFPVLINLSGGWLKTRTSGGNIYSSNGYDIIFRDANLNKLDHEIEMYDGSAGTLVAWVRIPTLFENNQDTAIYMDYGNASITSPTANPNGVWDSNYVGVWHLNESGTGGVGEYKDSTQWTNHGTPGPDGIPIRESAKIGGGQHFEDNDPGDVIGINQDSELNITGVVTVEAWVQLHRDRPIDYQYNMPAGIVGKGQQYNLYHNQDGDRYVTFTVDTTSGGAWPTDTLPLPLNTWYHMVGTYDGSVARIYRDGVQQAFANTTGALDIDAIDVAIGWWGSPFDGRVDEVRISKVARNACWIETNYKNQYAPGSFTTVGNEIVLGTFEDRKQITINVSQRGSSCTGPLSNFPVLINLSGDWLKTKANGGSIYNSNGYDIIFRDVNGNQLDHEIEYYNGSGSGSGGTVDVKVSASSDDAEENAAGGTPDLTSTDLELIYDSSDQQVGMRFLNITIPQGATITKAYIVFETDETDTGQATNLTFYAQAIDNAPTFAATANNITSRTKTTASVAWNGVPSWSPVGQTYQTPDLSPIIQEVVSRPGWTSGNALAVIVTGTSGSHRVAKSWDLASGTGAPLLHVEYSVSSPAKLVAWVRIPTLFDNNQDTVIYMYYGNPYITSPTANRSGVWDANYKGVWHLSETSGTQYDSTSNANNCTASVTKQGNAPAKITGADEFDMLDDYVSCGTSSTLDVTSASTFTIEAWIYPKTVGEGGYGAICARGGNSGKGYEYFLEYNPPVQAIFDNGTPSDVPSNNDGVVLNAWNFVTITVNGSAITFYRNGVSWGGGTKTMTAYGSATFYIGSWDGANDTFDGYIDEVRVSNTARSQCWIQTAYNNSSSPATFSTIGTGEEFDYKYRKKITILNSMTPSGCTSDLSNFPVLISESGSWLKTVANGGNISHPYGYDIIFKAEDGETKLDHEIEKYDGTATGGTLVAWVRIPTLKYNADTIIYMYYGNPTITSPRANPTGVWDSSYKAVYHLKETSGNQNDSTSNANHLTTVAVTNQGTAAGKMDGADQFNGSTNYAQTNSTSAFDVAAGNSMTVEAWINTSSTSGFVVNRKDGPDGIPGWQLYVTGSGTIEFRFIDNSNNTATATSSGTVNNGQYHYVVGRWSGGSKTAEILVDNLSPVSATNASVGANTVTRSLVIGREGDDTPAYYFNGPIDEVRFSSTARNNCWIGTSYANQSSPSASYTIGGQENLLDFKYRKQITILDSMTPASCSNNLTNYPIHLSLSGNWLKTKAADPVNGCIENASGYDIIFRAQDGVTKLDHEIEKYDGSAGTLVAWVRIPTLLYNANTIIYMYYGNSTITSSQANPTGVWNTSYGWRGVWHLGETSGNALDSTSYGTNGTVTGTYTRPSTSPPGQIGDAYDFGTNGQVSCGDPADGHLDFGTGSFTVSLWLNLDASTGTYQLPVYKGGTMVGDPGYDFETNTVASNIKFGITDSTYNRYSPQAIVDFDTWTHLVGVVDRANNRLRIYKNGVEQGTGTDITGVGSVDSALPLVFPSANYDLDGTIDEVRIAAVARDACWIGTEYTNQNSPLASYTIEGEEFDYKYRKQITIKDSMTPASDCSSDLTNFPVLISLSNQPWLRTKTADPVNGCIENASGYDIIFKAQDAETKLDHEIEKYDGSASAGTLVAWVRIPTLKYNADTIIYMYYGNPKITSPTANPAGVWDSNFKAVWHLKENPSGTAPQMKDSTQYANHTTSYGSMTVGDQVDGKIDGSLDFDGSDDYVEAPDYDILNAITISAWIKWDAVTAEDGIVSKRTSNEVAGDWALRLDGSGTGRLEWILWSGVDTQQSLLSVSAISTGVWSHVVLTFDDPTNTAKIYINGVLNNTTTSMTNTLANTPEPIRIGFAGQGSQFFDGLIDEVRISNVAKSACWIGTEYYNQYSPSTYISVEGVENMDYKYNQQITISKDMISTNCSSDLTNFPVLISLSGNWLKTVGSGGNIYSSDGYDIIFRDENGLAKLDHEIEDYNGTAGTLLAWVRIPTLHFNANTSIYIYYGNSAISSPTANAPGVWNNNYRAVMHLKESGNGTLGEYKDSSPYTNHGQGGGGYGSLYVPTRVAGKVGYGQDFNNSDGKYDLVDLGNNSSLDVIGNQITLEAWVQHNVSVERPYGILNHKGWYYGYSIWMQGDHWQCPSGETRCVEFNLPGEYYKVYTQKTLTGSTWHHVVGTYDGALMKVFIDGVQDSNTVAKTDNLTAPSPPENDVWIGHGDQPVDVGWSAEWLGQIDEVRISSVARDACWIQTEYNNMNSPTTYFTLTSEAGFAPTYVKLTSFKATSYAEGTLLEWRTSYEVDNLGFHVYREENGQLIRLTPEPVAGTALLAGKLTRLGAGYSYSWWDSSAPSSQLSAVRYWLKDIDLKGTETMHGPVTPALSRDPLPQNFRPELLSEVGQRRQDRYRDYWRVQELRERLVERPLATSYQVTDGKLKASILKARRGDPLSSRPGADLLVQQYLAGRPAVKILVTEEGLYRVTQPELVEAGLSSSVNPRCLQLFVEGKEQAISVTGETDGKFDPGDAVEFYGVGIDTPSTDVNVYWLVEGTRPGKRLGELRSQGGQVGPPSFLHTEARKDRVIYFPNLKNGDEENWFGPVISPSRADQILMVRHLDLAHSGDARLEVSIQGVTEVPHRVKVFVNEVEVDEAVFEGQTKFFVQVEVPQALLLEGENLVSFMAVGGEMDYSFLDLIRLSYWHTYTADGDELKFKAQGGQHLILSGFSHPWVRVFDITSSGNLVEVLGRVVAVDGGYRVELGVPGTGERTLLALSVNKVKTPGGLVLNKPSSWSQVSSGYDSVMISHRSFIEAIKSLKQLRESQGLSVALADLEDVYDEFSFGIKSPKAIKDFLSFAKTKWKKSPRFVLLVGDASFDPKNYYGFGYWDFVPTKLIDTQYLETASDDWFVDFDNDGLPEMAIGRLPVRTPEETNVLVSKILTYEQSGAQNIALLVADKIEWEDDFDFEAASEEVRNILPSSLMASKIYRSQFSSDSQAKSALLASINGGSLLVNFIGHGSLDMWRGILASEDVTGLTNRVLPFFINMTCLNGFFQDPYMDSLAETLVKAGGGGAIGVWTSSGVTEPANQARMNMELLKLLFNGNSLTLGEATSRAKAATNDQDVRKTWILFGDPSMRLK